VPAVKWSLAAHHHGTVTHGTVTAKVSCAADWRRHRQKRPHQAEHATHVLLGPESIANVPLGQLLGDSSTANVKQSMTSLNLGVFHRGAPRVV
jgi:hypothetical protein